VAIQCWLRCWLQWSVEWRVKSGLRNEIHAGIEQAFVAVPGFFGRVDYEYTHNGYDFSVLGNTPITFPIEWQQR